MADNKQGPSQVTGQLKVCPPSPDGTCDTNEQNIQGQAYQVSLSLSATPFILDNMGTNTHRRQANARRSELSYPKLLIPNHGLHPVPSSRKREKQRLKLLKLRKRWELLLIPQLGNSSRKLMSPFNSFVQDGRTISFVSEWIRVPAEEIGQVSHYCFQNVRVLVCVKHDGHKDSPPLARHN